MWKQTRAQFDTQSSDLHDAVVLTAWTDVKEVSMGLALLFLAVTNQSENCCSMVRF